MCVHPGSMIMATLAPEILSAIFLLSTPFNYSDGRTIDLCRKWKEVAQDTPDLWTPIKINIPPQTCNPWNLYFVPDDEYQASCLAISRHTDLIIRWLSHAGEAKLSVHIDNFSMLDHLIGNNHDRKTIWDRPIFEMLERITAQRFIGSWRSLKLTWIGPTAIPFLLNMPGSQLKSLEELHVSRGLVVWERSADAGELGRRMTLLSEVDKGRWRGVFERGVFTAPFLKRLYLNLENMNSRGGLACFKFPSVVWEGLTHLTIHRHPAHPACITMSDAFSILCRCADTLRYIQLNVEPIREDGNISALPSPLFLPQLTELDIIIQSPGNSTQPYAEFFALIRTPVLSTLKHTWGAGHGEEKLPLLAFVKSNQAHIPRLTHVTLESYESIQQTDFEELFDILGGTGSRITALNLGSKKQEPIYYLWGPPTRAIGHTYFTPKMLERFYGARAPLFPKLERVGWKLRDKIEVGPDDLLAFLGGELGSLQEVSVKFCDWVRVPTDALSAVAAQYGVV
ncbi:hypothetical protein BKA70DRAFT_1326141, partial [Coprinopsis sp. MPI-PUGE-AT-0042]